MAGVVSERLYLGVDVSCPQPLYLIMLVFHFRLAETARLTLLTSPVRSVRLLGSGLHELAFEIQVQTYAFYSVWRLASARVAF